MPTFDDYAAVNARRKELGQQPILLPLPLVASLRGGQSWREWQHPRDRMGKWIEKLGRVKIFGRGKSKPEGTGWVKRLNRDGSVLVQTDAGGVRRVTPDLLEGSDAKAFLPREAMAPPPPVDIRKPQRPWSPSHPAFTGAAAEITQGKSWPEIRDAMKDRSIVVFDFETTGLDVDADGDDRPVEVAAVRLRNGKVVDRFHKRMNPKKPVGFSQTVHGISDEQAALEADYEDVIREFRDFVGSDMIAAHNAGFDTVQYDTILNELGLDRQDSGVIDTLSLARHLLAAKSKGGVVDNHKLISLANYFGIDLGSRAHSADGDTEATGELLGKLFDYAAEHNPRPYDTSYMTERWQRDLAAFPEKIKSYRQAYQNWLTSWTPPS